MIDNLRECGISVTLLATVFVAACDIHWVKDDSTKSASAKDSVTVLSGAPGTRPDSAVAVDTLVGLAFGDSEILASATSASPKAASDTTSIIATAVELQRLATALDVPVQGVARSQLRDNFSEGRSGHTHEALDIPAPRGTPVLSAADGRILKLFESKQGGHMIYAADASDHFILMYAHLDRYAPALEEGMPLRRGQLIAYVGTSGNAPPDTPHLHFAIARGRPSLKWWKGTPVNPYPLLAKEPAARGGN